MSWLFGGGETPKDAQSFRWDTGATGSLEEAAKVIEVLKQRYEDIAYKCAEETQRKDEILKKLKVLEKKDASVGECAWPIAHLLASRHIANLSSCYCVCGA